MNRLASEKSPYLLQHADNPVDWHAWGEEAFETARREDKPIFLSIGYSTCHWCHVMAHESFEDARVAAVLNEHFVPIKVDREERPDVDRVYMSFVQATTGSGGWPMSVWLTPDLRPFYGGTYFPPSSRWGRPGFVEVLREMSRLWRDERGRVEAAASGVIEHLAGAAASGAGARVPGAMALDGAVRELLANVDRRDGGFGAAPKFPRPSELLFLLREHRRTGDAAPAEAAFLTLRAMAAGGMRDQVGGGFHRYSVDARWRVPHFEKMLYDQAQLVLAYLEAGQASGDRFFIDVAEDTLAYVQRVLTDRDGGFYSAEDADSLPPGSPDGGHKSEGAFYLWSVGEIEAALGGDARAFCLRFGVEPGGNALQDPQGEFAGRNILYQARTIEDVAAAVGSTPDASSAAISRARDRLLRVRDTRPRPHLDDKIIAAWNGLMVAAFARASRVVRAVAPGPEGTARADGYLEAARRAAAFLRDRMREGATGRLVRRYRDGQAAIDAFAEDYACVVFGLLELFQADGDAAWLAWAADLQRLQDEQFWDDERGGWFSTSGRDPRVLMRLKEEYDGAEPAASSVSALNSLALAHLGAPVDDAAARVERTLALFGPRLSQASRAVPMMLAVLSAWHAGVVEVVMAGDAEQPAARELVAAFDSRHEPFAVLVRAGAGGGRLVGLLPWTRELAARGGAPTAYVCRDFTCERPAMSAAELAERLG